MFFSLTSTYLPFEVKDKDVAVTATDPEKSMLNNWLLNENENNIFSYMFTKCKNEDQP